MGGGGGRSKADARNARTAAGGGAALEEAPPAEGAPEIDSQIGAEAWGERAFGAWADSLSPDEQAAIGDYRRAAYGPLNTLLNRGGKLNAYHSYVRDQLDSALSRARLPAAMTVYRGVTDWRKEFGAKKLSEIVGAVGVRKGYGSTSVLKSMAGEFTDETNPRGAILKFHLPKGARAAFLGPRAGTNVPQSFHVEKEVLLARGARYRVTKVTKSKGSRLPTIHINVL